MLLIQSTLHYSQRSFTALVSEMSGSGRKRSSKWDLRDDPEFAPGSKQLRSGWSSEDVAGSNSSKWSYLEGNDKFKPGMGFSSKDGGRGMNKDDIMNKDQRVLDATMEWDTDGSHNKKMSPWLEEWKQKEFSQSPKNDWSRSVRFVSLLSVSVLVLFSEYRWKLCFLVFH